MKIKIPWLQDYFINKKYSPADVKSRNKAGTSYRVKPRKIRTEG